MGKFAFSDVRAIVPISLRLATAAFAFALSTLLPPRFRR